MSTTETGSLVEFTKHLAHYMEIAMTVTGNEKLAEIAIDKQDMETMKKIAEKLEKLEQMEKTEADQDE